VNRLQPHADPDGRGSQLPGPAAIALGHASRPRPGQQEGDRAALVDDPKRLEADRHQVVEAQSVGRAGDVLDLVQMRRHPAVIGDEAEPQQPTGETELAHQGSPMAIHVLRTVDRWHLVGRQKRRDLVVHAGDSRRGRRPVGAIHSLDRLIESPAALTRAPAISRLD